MSSSSAKPPYLVRTSELSSISSLDRREHPVDSRNHRYACSLGDSTGLTKTGVHFCRLPPDATSTTLHYHTHDDEWYYIIDAGEGAVLFLWEPEATADGQQDSAPREEKIQSGDFFGFKAGASSVRAHALRAGEKEVVYLVGGSREQTDMSVYPLKGRRMIISRSQELGVQTWTVEEKDLKTVHMKAPAQAGSGQK
ncbi:hypothetical protein GY45DRAFT_1327420 [Cubamyces sp. BRFM 1775]|nr:hypothetical protein GY45DRAFT_1327420 [Cubamyces sp. BRFM 1775]